MIKSEFGNRKSGFLCHHEVPPGRLTEIVDGNIPTEIGAVICTSTGGTFVCIYAPKDSGLMSLRSYWNVPNDSWKLRLLKPYEVVNLSNMGEEDE